MTANDPVPTPRQVRTWLLAHGWTQMDPLATDADESVDYLHKEPSDDGQDIWLRAPQMPGVPPWYPLLVREVIVTAAGMEDRPEEEVLAEMLAIEPARPAAPRPAPSAALAQSPGRRLRRISTPASPPGASDAHTPPRRCRPRPLGRAGRSADDASSSPPSEGGAPTHCARCHGQDGSVEGSLNYVADLTKLVARKKVVPNDPAASRLFRRVADGTMPPPDEQPRPSPAEVAALKKWIEAGAPADGAAPARPALAQPDVYAAVLQDLETFDRRARRFQRYFTLTTCTTPGCRTTNSRPTATRSRS
jgi:cytochrome c553